MVPPHNPGSRLATALLARQVHQPTQPELPTQPGLAELCREGEMERWGLMGPGTVSQAEGTTRAMEGEVSNPLRRLNARAGGVQPTHCCTHPCPSEPQRPRLYTLQGAYTVLSSGRVNCGGYVHCHLSPDIAHRAWCTVGEKAVTRQRNHQHSPIPISPEEGETGYTHFPAQKIEATDVTSHRGCPLV